MADRFSRRQERSAREETASERFKRRSEEGLDYDWSAFCVVGDYCTRPCRECGADGRKYAEARKAREKRESR